MIDFPNAKINIGLNVLAKRPDGFHDLETVFYPIKLADILEINIAKEFSFTQTGLLIEGSPNQNLVVKAYNILAKEFELDPVNIHLHKIIPFGAGLGGGSSDAAFTIKMLNSMFNLGLSIPEMEAYAAKLGSDCPFFIANKPIFAEGRGEIFSKTSVDLAGFHLVLVNPEIHVSTAEAYAGIIPNIPELRLTDITNYSISDWQSVLKNDFELAVFQNHPEIKSIKDKLIQMGAVYASMSGSGSTVFGIFNKNPMGISAAFKQYFVWQEMLD